MVARLVAWSACLDCHHALCVTDIDQLAQVDSHGVLFMS